MNDANGRGTPDVATSGSVRTLGRKSGGDTGLINLLTPRRKRPVTGSYSVARPARPADMLEPSHSFRRQNSLATAAAGGSVVTKTLSPQPHSSPAVLSPCRDRLPSPAPTGETPVSQASEVCPVDEVDTPGKQSDDDTDDDLDEEEEIPDHDGSYSISAPPLPPRTPNPNAISPGSVMSPGTSLAITTPRHRGGLMLCSRGQLDKWRMLLDSQQSPCQPHQYNEDEPEEATVDQDNITSDNQRTRALSAEFKEFLASHGMEADEDESEDEGSLLETSSSYSEEVRRLLGRDTQLSDSLQAAMDGEEEPVLGEINDNVKHCDEPSKDKVKPVENPEENTENISPTPRRGVKRRSITEAGPQTAANVTSSVQNTAIVFETDL